MPKKIIKKNGSKKGTIKKQGKVLRLKKSKKSQKGGLSVCPVGVDPGSTSGDLSALIGNIDGLIGSVYNSVCTAVTTVIDVVELPWAVKDAYSDPTAAELGIRY